MHKTFALLFVIATVASNQRAHAQSCPDSTPPKPDGVASTACDSPATCPGPADDATHWSGGQYVYFPATPLDVGACDTSNPAAYRNGCTDARATCITATNRCNVQYVGLLYRPTTPPATPGPAMVLVPGSTGCTGSSCIRQPGKMCELKANLVANGYTALELLPRGYGTDATHRSDGWYVDDAVSQMEARGDACAATGGCGTRELVDEGQDVKAAFDYLLTQTSYVNPNAIGVFGHSLGGIRVLSFNRTFHGQRATVVMAPGSESWCKGSNDNTILQSSLVQSVDEAKSAMYNFMPQNDVALGEGQVLTTEAGLNHFQYQSAVLPPVTANGVPMKFGDEAHACFINNKRDVDGWFPSVLDFIRRYGVK